MNEQLLIQAIQISLSAAALFGIAIVLSSTWYDLRVVRIKKLSQIAIEKTKKNEWPAVAVLVYAHDNASTIVNCLQSIRLNNYSNCQIIVVDNASTDKTEKAVLSFKRHNPTIPIVLYRQRTKVQRSSVLRTAHNEARAHDYTLVVDANATLPPTVIKSAVARFMINEHLDTLRLRPLSALDRSIASLPLVFIQLSKNLAIKAAAGRTVSRRNYLDSGVITQSKYFKRGNFPKKITASYASNIPFTPPHPSRRYHTLIEQKPIIGFGKFFSYLCIVTATTYVIYTAATLQSNTLLTLSWLLVSLWLTAVIWLDDALRLSAKIELSMTVPFMYFLIYASLVITLGANLWHIIRSSTTTHLEALNLALQIELYSTRY